MQRKGDVVGDEGMTESRGLSSATAVRHEKINNRNASRLSLSKMALM